MKRNLKLLASTFIIAFALIFLSLSNSRTSAISPGSECGDCMRTAAESYVNCLQAGKIRSVCRRSFEAQREFCLTNVCKDGDEGEIPEEPLEPAESEEPPQP